MKAKASTSIHAKSVRLAAHLLASSSWALQLSHWALCSGLANCSELFALAVSKWWASLRLVSPPWIEQTQRRRERKATGFTGFNNVQQVREDKGCRSIRFALLPGSNNSDNMCPLPIIPIHSHSFPSNHGYRLLTEYLKPSLLECWPNMKHLP